MPEFNAKNVKDGGNGNSLLRRIYEEEGSILTIHYPAIKCDHL